MATGEGGYASSPGPKVENGLPRAERDLERPHDPAVVGRLHPSGRHGIEHGQAGVEIGHRRPGRRPARPPGPPCTVGIAAGEPQVVDHGPQVEAGAAHQERVVAPGGDAAQRVAGRPLELGRR